MASYKITLSQSNWSGGTAAFWYDTVTQGFFADENLTEEIYAITPPARELYRFNGFFSSASNGTQYIDEAGGFTFALYDLAITANKTFYAQGAQVSRKLTLSANGAVDAGGDAVPDGALYQSMDDGMFYADYLCAGDPVTSVSRPANPGYAFAGYYNGTSTPGTQYIDASGDFTAALESLSLTGNKTIYARWLAPYKITISANSGSGGTAAFYFDSVSGRFYAEQGMSEEIAAIAPHARECYAFLGCRASNNDTSDLRVNADGTIADGWTPNAATTIYARWSLVSRKITINRQSGTGGATALYYRIGGGGYYLDDLCAHPTEGPISVPTRPGYVFTGLYSGTSSSAVQYVDKLGSFTAAFSALAPSGNLTIYAQWNQLYKITMNKQGGGGGSDVLYYDKTENEYYFDELCTDTAVSVFIPERECHRFDGYYKAASGNVQYINAAGLLNADMYSQSFTGNVTVYAHWTKISHRVALDDNGGSGGTGVCYIDADEDTLPLAYADWFLSETIGDSGNPFAIPVRTGHTFLGYYTARTGGSRIVTAEGVLVNLLEWTRADQTLYARWQANTYTITFDYNGGTGGIASKEVTFGTAVGTLPAPTPPSRSDFRAWTVGGEPVDESTVWGIAADVTLQAQYDYWFGTVVDYFRLGGPRLVPIDSKSGDARKRTCSANGGRYSQGVNDAGGIWRNPTVVYQVVGDCTVDVVLGKAFAATRSGGTMTVSGYMITSVRVRTQLGKFPVVEVSATANEGANAINLFAVSIPVLARAKAQNLLGAISGGGSLQVCDASAECTPVVCEENNMPCASDVVKGRIKVHGTLYAPEMESAPSAANGFASVGEPKSCGDTSYQLWDITTEKEIV